MPCSWKWLCILLYFRQEFPTHVRRWSISCASLGAGREPKCATQMEGKDLLLAAGLSLPVQCEGLVLKSTPIVALWHQRLS